MISPTAIIGFCTPELERTPSSSQETFEDPRQTQLLRWSTDNAQTVLLGVTLSVLAGIEGSGNRCLLSIWYQLDYTKTVNA